MVRSKKKSSSNKSLKNMHPSQLNNPRRNNFGGSTSDMDMQHHNMMPNDMTHNTANVNKQDNLVTQSIVNLKNQNLNMKLNSVSQNIGNANKQDHNLVPNITAQSLANLNRQNFSIMLNAMTQNTANMNKQDHNMLPNAVTQLPQWHSQITMSDILSNYVGGSNSGNSLFTSGCDLSAQSNFQPIFNCNQINSNNGIHSFIDQSNLHPLIYGIDLSENGPKDNVASHTVPVERSYGKHSLFKKYDHYFSFKVMKTSNSETSEFKMRNKDFPALPGTQMQMHTAANTSSTRIDSNQQWRNTTIGSKLLNKLNMDKSINHNSSESHLDTDFHLNGSTVPKPGVQTSLDDGTVTNIPSSMLRDQFGIIGQLINMRTAKYDPKLVELTFGQDLTSLGLNLNSPENIYPTFAGPFEDFPLEPHNIEYDVPPEYKIHHKIKDKLAPIKLSEYKEDLLFYLFFTHIGDEIQMAVASELRTRGWRYHTKLYIWITPATGSSTSKINDNIGCGTFYVFDKMLWRKVPKELMLDHTLLDGYVANDSFIPPNTSTR